MRYLLQTVREPSIGIVDGIPGSGKSAYLVELMSYLPGIICTNIDLKPSHPAYPRYVPLGARHGLPIWENRRGGLGFDVFPSFFSTPEFPLWIIVDEAHRQFSQWTLKKMDALRAEQLVERLSLHRKLNHRFIFATQHHSKLFVEIRRCAAWYINCFDLGKSPDFRVRMLPENCKPFRRVMYFEEEMIKPVADESAMKTDLLPVFGWYDTAQMDLD